MEEHQVREQTGREQFGVAWWDTPRNAAAAGLSYCEAFLNYLSKVSVIEGGS